MSLGSPAISPSRVERMSVRAAATTVWYFMFIMIFVEVSEVAAHLRLGPRAPQGGGTGTGPARPCRVWSAVERGELPPAAVASRGPAAAPRAGREDECEIAKR